MVDCFFDSITLYYRQLFSFYFLCIIHVYMHICTIYQLLINEILSESAVALSMYGCPGNKMAAHTMQWKVIIAKHTNKQDLTFQNCPEVVSNDFLGDLCV